MDDKMRKTVADLFVAIEHSGITSYDPEGGESREAADLFANAYERVGEMLSHKDVALARRRYDARWKARK